MLRTALLVAYLAPIAISTALYYLRNNAEQMLPRIRETIATYCYARIGDYRLWPGPNSTNTFEAAVMNAVPERRASLPATAIGKDFPYDGR